MKIDVKKSNLPQKSLLRSAADTYDYADSFEAEFTDENGTIDAAEVGKAFFAYPTKGGVLLCLPF